MRLSLTLTLLLGMATLFQGCSSTEENSEPATTTVKGSTTLASGFRAESKTTVCVDTNDNQQCDSDEPTTSTDISGKYTLTLPSELSDGSLIIVQEGLDLLPLTETNETMRFYKYFKKSEGEQNINIVSRLIVDELAANPDNSYEEVKNTLANRYNIDPEVIEKDPFVIKGDFLNRVIGLQALDYNQSLRAQPSASLNAAARASEAPTESELDAFLAANESLLDEYLELLNEYLDALSAWYDALFEDDEEVVEEVIVPDEVRVLPITRAALNGAWYIIDASGDKTCSLIKSNNDISVTEADGKTTDLTLTYTQEGDNASMKLSLGFFTADTIRFTEYKSDSTFKGKYTSDGETLSGVKMSSVTLCKSERLGL